MLPLELFTTQNARWPRSGRHILAHFDADSIVVYQAYSPSIADFAVQNGYFGGDFSFHRMSWIKPNFLWMNYRSGWNSKPNTRENARGDDFARIVGRNSGRGGAFVV